jgi:hypothetical protein
MVPSRTASLIGSLAAVACFACGSSSTSGSSKVETGNLIVNGNAEAAAGSMDGTPVATPGWTSTGEATAIQYGASGGYPATTDPGPTDRGMNFLGGGTNDAMSSLTQSVDVSQYASDLDTGSVVYDLTGWLGGWSDQSDNATLTITFQDGTGASVGTAVIGPVTVDMRMSNTGLIQQSATGMVPKGTRKLDVSLVMVRTDGTTNDGYADDLSLTFTGS